MAVDWWAIGILIYEMLIGRTPFIERSREKILNKIVKSNVKWPDRKKFKI